MSTTQILADYDYSWLPEGATIEITKENEKTTSTGKKYWFLKATLRHPVGVFEHTLVGSSRDGSIHTEWSHVNQKYICEAFDRLKGMHSNTINSRPADAYVGTYPPEETK